MVAKAAAVGVVVHVLFRLVAGGRTVFRILKDRSKAAQKARNKPETEEVAKGSREELEDMLPGRRPSGTRPQGRARRIREESPGARGGRLKREAPGARGGRIRPGEGTLPPRNKGGVVRSTTKQGSKKPTIRREKK